MHPDPEAVMKFVEDEFRRLRLDTHPKTNLWDGTLHLTHDEDKYYVMATTNVGSELVAEFISKHDATDFLAMRTANADERFDYPKIMWQKLSDFAPPKLSSSFCAKSSAGSAPGRRASRISLAW